MIKPTSKLGAGYDVAISPDGKIVCAMPSSAPAKLYRTADWSQLCCLKGLSHPRKVWFSDDATRIVVASFDKKAASFNVTSGEMLATVRTGHGEWDALCVSPSGGEFLASSTLRGIQDDETSLVVYSLSDGKPLEKLVICDDKFSGHRATAAAFTRNGRYLVACWNRTGNGFDGAYLSVYQWPTLEHKSTVSLGENVKPCDLFIGKNASSVLVSIASGSNFHAKSMWKISCPSLKKSVIWEDVDSAGNEQSGFHVSPCGKRFTYFALDRIETWRTNGESMIASTAISSGREIYSALLTSDKKAFVVGDGAVHIYSNGKAAE